MKSSQNYVIRITLLYSVSNDLLMHWNNFSTVRFPAYVFLKKRTNNTLMNDEGGCKLKISEDFRINLK